MKVSAINDIQRLYVQARCVMMTSYIEDYESMCASVDALWNAMTYDEQNAAVFSIPPEVYSTPLEAMYKPV